MLSGVWFPLRFVPGVLPVFAFLFALQGLDSWQLVRRRTVLQSVAWGCLAAGISYGINQEVPGWMESPLDWYARLGAPALEEICKAAWVVFMVRTARVGFMVDAAICGFAAGAGFALVENAAYMHHYAGSPMPILVLRGFGTAMMHGGTTAIVGVVSAGLPGRDLGHRIRSFLPGLALAIAIHASYNMAVLSPLESSLAVIVGLPMVFVGVFAVGERSMQRWMGRKLDKDIELLDMIASGRFFDSTHGEYLKAIAKSFPPRVVGDMLCTVQVASELSARAKGIMIMQAAGLPPSPDPSLAEQLQELRYLEKSIGVAGRRALAPLVSLTSRDLWEIRKLSEL